MEAILVLNGGAQNDDIDIITQESCRLAFEWWKKDHSRMLVVTGGHLLRSEQVRFSAAMKEFLMELGIPSKNILEEAWPSLDTIQNLRAALEALKTSEISPSRIILVATSRGHLWRAKRTLKILLRAEKLSIPVISVASAPKYPFTLWEFGAKCLSLVDPLGTSWISQKIRDTTFRKAGVKI